MDRIIEKSDLGWWIVSHEQKLWLPGGEIPYGAADIFDLVGQPALRIGEWQGDPVWLIQQARRQDMGSVRQVLDRDVGLFQLAGRGVQLAQHTRHRNGIHTVLAGFVEVGETLEQAVAREVMEESGIKVKNLRYVTSQPWPFPMSLMTAFMAEYDSGEIVIDQKELLEANWYRYDDLPLLPPPGTVARRLIEDTVAMCRAEYE